MLNITISQQDIEVFFLVLVRIASFVSVAPFFGESNVPVRYKLAFAIGLSYLIYLIIPDVSLPYDTTLGYATLIIKESIVGLLVGFSAYICNTIVLFAGRIIDMDIGLSMANLYDPSTRQQVSLNGSFYQRVIMILLILSGMHLYLLGAIKDTFTLIPIGGLSFNMSLYNSFIGFLADYFIIGFRIILPIFAVILIVNCAMGIMTKVAPQIHMFSVGMQIKILIGLLALFMTIILLPNIADVLIDEMKTMVVEAIRGMS